jgi:hypothetical protein
MVEPRLLNNLAAQLPMLWPAHELLVWERSSEFDLIHVQGRGDRLHGLTLVQGEDDLARAAGQAQALCNWYWMVVAPDASAGVRAAVQDVRADWRAGVLEWRDGGLHKLHQAPPRPGIFVTKYPDLRAEWRKISSW